MGKPKPIKTGTEAGRGGRLPAVLELQMRLGAFIKCGRRRGGGRPRRQAAPAARWGTSGGGLRFLNQSLPKRMKCREKAEGAGSQPGRGGGWGVHKMMCKTAPARKAGPGQGGTKRGTVRVQIFSSGDRGLGHPTKTP